MPISRKIAAEFQGWGGPDPPTPGTWFAQDSPRFFEVWSSDWTIVNRRTLNYCGEIRYSVVSIIKISGTWDI